jgi:excisionase family DNA binding protein
MTDPELDESEEVALTIEDLAKAMRTSTRTIRRRIKEGKIRKIEGLGRLVRIHPSEVGRLARLNEL